MPGPGIEIPTTVSFTIGGAPGIDASGGICACDIALSVTRTDSTHLRVTFSRAVRFTPWVTSLLNWSVRDRLGIAPALTVRAISPQNTTAPSYVDLTTAEQRSGVSYIVEAYVLEAN